MKKTSYFSVLFLLTVTTMIASYVAVPVIEKIIDSAAAGEAVFVIGTSVPAAAESYAAQPYAEGSGLITRILNFFFPSEEKIEYVENALTAQNDATPQSGEVPQTANETPQTNETPAAENEGTPAESTNAVLGASQTHAHDVDTPMQTSHPHDIADAATAEEKESAKGKITTSGGGSGARWNMDLYDPDVQYSATTNVNIFDVKDKIIAPGSNGVYYFTVDNSKNGYSITYDVSFVEDNKEAVPMVYDLQIEGYDTYLCQNQPCTALTQSDIYLRKGAKTRYKLTWRWPYEGDHTAIASAADGERGTYSLKVKVDAYAN